ncbi:MAG TPA: hypothetical protein VFS32_10845 [Candidatus Limnocylindrales bacterium]|nr:hypothetical protein [Candidatus Limnocylindrales bacterium]
MAVENAGTAGEEAAAGLSIDRRALALWPGLDRRALARCRHDPERIARLVARRTALDVPTIRALLTIPVVDRQEVSLWFG